MKLKEIIWEKSRKNSAVQSGRIGTEYVALIKKIGKQWECAAGNGILQGGAPVWVGSEQLAKRLCAEILAGEIESFCDGKLDIGPEHEYLVSSVVGDEAIGQVRHGGIYKASSLADAVAQLIKGKFKNGDGAPLTGLCLDKLQARRTSHAGN